MVDEDKKSEPAKSRLSFFYISFCFTTLPSYTMANISTEFISIGCNRTTHAAAWAANGLVAFGADKFVALYDPLVRKNNRFSRLRTNEVSCL
jgi:hypothetical protein